MKTSLITVLLAGTFVSISVQAGRDHSREKREKSRIEGLSSEQLAQYQARKLEKMQKRIDKLLAKANADGVVTPEEKAKIEKAQERQSRLILKQKHGQPEPGNRDGTPAVPPQESIGN